ncbi:MAG: RES family NAD+ phosphorylase [Phycisphaerales bacterium]
MARAWRICKRVHAATAFDGEATRRVGGRWTSSGVVAVYASEHLSLAILEVLVHLERPQAIAAFVAFEVTIPDDLIDAVDARKLPKEWRDSPAPLSAKLIGDRWASELRSPVLRVPSAVVPQEHNLVLNPLHAKFKRLSIGKSQALDADSRVFAKR